MKNVVGQASYICKCLTKDDKVVYIIDFGRKVEGFHRSSSWIKALASIATLSGGGRQFSTTPAKI